MSAGPRFRVHVLLPAASDLADITDYISFDSPENARSVVLAILRRVDSLERMPRRFPLAPDVIKAEGELRHASVMSHRIIYEVLGSDVFIHAVRHAARRPIRPGDTAK